MLAMALATNELHASLKLQACFPGSPSRGHKVTGEVSCLLGGLDTLLSMRNLDQQRALLTELTVVTGADESILSRGRQSF